MSAERLWILLAKKKSGEATPEELEELKALQAKNSSSGFSNEIMDKIWDTPMKSIPEHNAPSQVWQRIEAKTADVPTAKSILLRSVTWIAAASFLAAATVLVAMYLHTSVDNAPLIGQNYNQVSTQPGSKLKLELPDGTQVWLNGNSKLTYSNGSFGVNNREVTLSGEAFFDVVKNEKVPFIIHTGPVNITVKGTAFNVKAYPKGKTVETALVRGLVEITTQQDPERKILLKPNEKIIIPVNRDKDGKLHSIAPDSVAVPLYTITKLKTSDKEPEEIAWVNSQLIFDDEPFSAIAPRMENWYHIKIHFTSEDLKDRRFSGVIENESLRETLEAMRLSYHFNYELKGNDLWIGDK